MPLCIEKQRIQITSLLECLLGVCLAGLGGDNKVYVSFFQSSYIWMIRNVQLNKVLAHSYNTYTYMSQGLGVLKILIVDV